MVSISMLVVVTTIVATSCYEAGLLDRRRRCRWRQPGRLALASANRGRYFADCCGTSTYCPFFAGRAVSHPSPPGLLHEWPYPTTSSLNGLWLYIPSYEAAT